MKKILFILVLLVIVCTSCAPRKRVTVPLGDYMYTDIYQGYNRIVFSNYVILSNDTVVPKDSATGLLGKSRNIIILDDHK